jgi:hypothetical protein
MRISFWILILIFSLFLQNVKGQVDTLTASLNPFPTSTDLTIHNLTNDTVSFKIYNSTGLIVADFFESNVLTGTITVTFDADTLPNGVYFAILTKNSENRVLKLVKDPNATGLIFNSTNLETEIIQIYPNPAVNLLSISTGLKITELKIFNSSGKLLQSTNGEQKTIDLTNLDSGFYLLFLKTEDTYFIKKIFKK